MYLAMSGSAVVHAKAAGLATASPGQAGPDNLNWFLNGSLLPGDQARRLTLSPGSYELRCVDNTGNASAVKFTVR